jgi:hypothetical protein
MLDYFFPFFVAPAFFRLKDRVPQPVVPLEQVVGRVRAKDEDKKDKHDQSHDLHDITLLVGPPLIEI